MHFCPRPACRRSYHRQCLANNNKYRDRDLETRDLRLLASSPDTDEVFDLFTLFSRSPEYDGTGHQPISPSGLLLRFPSDLVLIAKQPIVKGVNSGGVVGNVRTIVNARRMIYEAIESATPVPGNWSCEMDVDTSLPQKGGTDNIPALLCPKCRGPV